VGDFDRKVGQNDLVFGVRFPGTISVKFYRKIKGWLWYKTAKKYCRKF